MSATSIVPSDHAGNAALAIIEALLLALNDANVLPQDEIVGVLSDAAAAHRNMPKTNGQFAAHQSVAALIQTIIDGGNSVRHG